MNRLGMLVSGRGSNFIAIADNIKSGELAAEIAIVISNRAEALAVDAAKQRGIAVRVIPSKGKARDAHDAEVIAELKTARVDLVCLAGYLRLLSPAFVRAFPHKILNIHPSLLPAFPGLDAQQQALDYGAKITGCTVHFVDDQLDHGPIIVQRAVPVVDDDNVATLSARILEQEHIAYSEAIARVLSGVCKIEGRCVKLQS